METCHDCALALRHLVLSMWVHWYSFCDTFDIAVLEEERSMRVTEERRHSTGKIGMKEKHLANNKNAGSLFCYRVR